MIGKIYLVFLRIGFVSDLGDVEVELEGTSDVAVGIGRFGSAGLACGIKTAVPHLWQNLLFSISLSPHSLQNLGVMF